MGKGPVGAFSRVAVKGLAAGGCNAVALAWFKLPRGIVLQAKLHNIVLGSL